MGRRAVFLDRDGTINEEVSFLSDPAQLRLLPGAVEGLRKLQDAGFVLVVVSNQSGVARGYFGEDAVLRVNAALSREMASRGVSIGSFYYCPHHPEGTVERYRRTCRCRKPAAGLLFEAAEALGLDLASSYSVGDSARDLAAGRSAGTGTVLVRTGYGRPEEAETTAGGLADFIAGDLEEAAEWILKDAGAGGGKSVDG